MNAMAAAADTKARKQAESWVARAPLLVPDDNEAKIHSRPWMR
jgi:hypothetical protein